MQMGLVEYETSSACTEREHATLHAIGNFAKSLNVIWNYADEYGMCKFLFLFHCNCVAVFDHFWDYGMPLKQSELGLFKVIENGTIW